MNANKKRINTPGEEKDLNEYLQTLKLQSFYDNYSKVAEMAAKNQWSYPQYLLQLAESELLLRNQRSIERRIKAARFPVVKTLEGFDWTWPKKINRLQVQDLFRLAFVEQKSNIIFLGGVGLGKTHLCSALAYQAMALR